MAEPEINVTALLRLIRGAGKRPAMDPQTQADAVLAVQRLADALEDNAPRARDLYLKATADGWVVTVVDQGTGGSPNEPWYILLPRGFGMKPVISRHPAFSIVDRIATLDG